MKRLGRILLWLAAGALGLVAVAFLIGLVSWRFALDGDRQHTQTTAALPLYPASGDGLVQASARGMKFRARVSGLAPADSSEGDDDSPALVMLHGFPETSIMWQPLIEAAESADMRALAFDQRGYSPGARPTAVADYVLPELVADVFAVADAFGISDFHVLGHDWGAAVAWGVALARNPRVLSVISLSVPHLPAFGEAIATDPEQQRRSWYMAVFRTPFLAEYLLGTLDMGLLKAMHVGNRGEVLDEYLRVFAEPGAMTAALNWYRASAFETAIPDGSSRAPVMIHVPALFIGGRADMAIAQSGIDAQAKYMQGPFESHMRDAGHWLMGEDTQFVVDTIMDFVARHQPQAPAALADPAGQAAPQTE